MVTLLPKNKSKIKSVKLKPSEGVKQNVPGNWVDFARLCKIRSGNKVVNFEPYDYQIALSNQIDLHFGTVVAKTRQLGITEAVACKFLHKACKNPGYAAVILSKSQIDSSNIAKRIRRMVDGLGEYVELTSDNLTDIQIRNGGRLLFRNSTANGTRGLESISDILLDEAAFTDDIERIYTSAIPSTEMVGDEARIVILSTPNGKSGFYWDRLTSGNPSAKDIELICNQIKSKQLEPTQFWTDENGWCKFITHWYAHPVYSLVPDYLEKIRIKKQLSNASVEQEYNLSFTESDVNIFPSDLVRAAAQGRFKEPEPGSTYFVGIDTSTIGDDYTIGIVIKSHRDFISVAAIYRERKHSIDYNLEKLGELIKKYKPLTVGIEITGGSGQIYLEELTKTSGRFSEVLPIRTTVDSKTAMIDKILLYLEKRNIYFPSDCPLVDELLSFRRSGKKLGAPSGKHDDSVMALAFALAAIPAKPAYNTDWLAKA